MTALPFLHFFHLAGVAVWIGGMFFAYLCLRPAAVAVLEPPLRLRLWQAVFARFFPWVWLAVSVILLSGVMMLMAIGMAGSPLYVHLMLVIGLVMMAIFAHVFFSPYAALKRCVLAEDWLAAGAALNRIRPLIAINLSLGLLTIAVATIGRLVA